MYGTRRLLNLYEEFRENEGFEEEDYNSMRFSFNNDHDWDEIIHSYGFDDINEDNYGRFGSKRATEIANGQETSSASSTIDNMMDRINLRGIRPKLLFKSTPFLFPGIRKCVHTKVLRMCLRINLKRKTVAMGMYFHNFFFLIISGLLIIFVFFSVWFFGKN